MRPDDATNAATGIVANSPSPTVEASVDPGWAWAAYQPSDERPWSWKLAAHLFRRAAFGASRSELEDAVAAGPKATIDRLLRPEADTRRFDREYDDYEEGASGIQGPRAWWLRRMVETPFPLQEKMTLFWHSHFGVAHRRVKDAGLIVQHVRTLRENALGSYREMLESAAQDPAVLLGLDAAASRRSMPNENFSRQLLTRLSLGPGNFGEEDVREAARAFTGWFVLRGKLRYFSHEHDAGVKQVLGSSGAWQWADIVRLVLDNSATAELLARKLYRWLISEEEDPASDLLEPLASTLAADYDLGKVIEMMLRSNLFFSDHAYRRRIKSPVELALGLIRAADAVVPTQQLGIDLAGLGQDLYNPPTVQGWLGAGNWINAATMIGRANLMNQLLSEQGNYGGKIDLEQIVPSSQRSEPAQAAQATCQLLLADETGCDQLLTEVPAEGNDVTDAWVRTFTYRVATLPEYHLS